MRHLGELIAGRVIVALSDVIPKTLRLAAASLLFLSACSGDSALPQRVKEALPASAPSPQPGWIADTRTGCRVWNPFQVPNESVMWTGACQNGFAQGQAVMQWFLGDTRTERYEG